MGELLRLDPEITLQVRQRPQARSGGEGLHRPCDCRNLTARCTREAHQYAPTSFSTGMSTGTRHSLTCNSALLMEDRSAMQLLMRCVLLQETFFSRRRTGPNRPRSSRRWRMASAHRYWWVSKGDMVEIPLTRQAFRPWALPQSYRLTGQNKPLILNISLPVVKPNITWLLSRLCKPSTSKVIVSGVPLCDPREGQPSQASRWEKQIKVHAE